MVTRGNVLWGVGWGIGLAVVFSLVAAVLYGIGGPELYDEIALPAVLALYLVGGIVAGAIVGALRPLTVTRLGAMFVGIFAFAPIMAGVVIAMDGAPWEWEPVSLSSVISGAVVLGPFYAWVIWEPPESA